MNTQPASHDRENLSLAQRLGELAVIAALIALAGFFGLHQSARTGFFTAGFGPLAALCLYGPIVIALAPPALRALTGRRGPARLPEAAANLSLALGTLYLLIAFPLDFTRLGDVLPTSLRFLLAWLTDGLGRVVMIFQVTLMFISAAANTWTHFSPPRRPAANLS